MSLRDHRRAAEATSWRRAQLQATVEAGSDERRKTWLKRHAARQQRREQREREAGSKRR